MTFGQDKDAFLSAMRDSTGKLTVTRLVRVYFVLGFDELFFGMLKTE